MAEKFTINYICPFCSDEHDIEANGVEDLTHLLIGLIRTNGKVISIRRGEQVFRSASEAEKDITENPKAWGLRKEDVDAAVQIRDKEKAQQDFRAALIGNNGKEVKTYNC